MSFLTEYFDNYRKHPYKKAKICNPELRYCPIKGEWLKPTIGTDDQSEWSDEDIAKFIKETMKNVRGRSTYYVSYCAHLPEDLKTRPFVAKPPKKKPCPEKDPSKKAMPQNPQTHKPLKPLNLHDTELLKKAKALYEQDLDHLVLEPLETHHRILGYARPRYYSCDISEYTNSFSRLSYVLMRDSLVKRRVINKGNIKVLVPNELIPIAPFDGERLF